MNINGTELRFDAPSGSRILSRGFGIDICDSQLLWSRAQKKWVNDLDGTCMLPAPCRTFRAFVRHLRKHRAELAGCEVIFVSRFVGHDIRARITP